MGMQTLRGARNYQVDPALVRTAPSVTFVKSYAPSDFLTKPKQIQSEGKSFPLPEKLQREPDTGISSDNYNSVALAQTQRWGVGASSNGRRVPEGVAIPQVGERPAAGELVS